MMRGLEALRIGHDQIQVKKEPVFQQTMFDEYIHVDGDAEKAEKVIRSIRRDISDEAYLDVYYATLSAEEDALQAIYNFLRVGFAVGCRVLDYYTNPHVMRILELRRKVGNESHHFREFARFQSLNGKVYVCHLEPKSDVIMLVGRHFADRMPSEHWMIIDDTRKTACVHPKDGTNSLRYLTDAEFETLRKTEEYEDEYTDMWKTFFHAWLESKSARIVSASGTSSQSGNENMRWNSRIRYGSILVERQEEQIRWHTSILQDMDRQSGMWRIKSVARQILHLQNLDIHRQRNWANGSRQKASILIRFCIRR